MGRGASYYAGELILQPRQSWTREAPQLLDLIQCSQVVAPNAGCEIERDYRAIGRLPVWLDGRQDLNLEIELYPFILIAGGARFKEHV